MASESWNAMSLRSRWRLCSHCCDTSASLMTSLIEVYDCPTIIQRRYAHFDTNATSNICFVTSKGTLLQASLGFSLKWRQFTAKTSPPVIAQASALWIRCAWSWLFIEFMMKICTTIKQTRRSYKVKDLRLWSSAKYWFRYAQKGKHSSCLHLLAQT